MINQLRNQCYYCRRAALVARLQYALPLSRGSERESSDPTGRGTSCRVVGAIKSIQGKEEHRASWGGRAESGAGPLRRRRFKDTGRHHTTGRSHVQTPPSPTRPSAMCPAGGRSLPIKELVRTYFSHIGHHSCLYYYYYYTIYISKSSAAWCWRWCLVLSRCRVVIYI